MLLDMSRRWVVYACGVLATGAMLRRGFFAMMCEGVMSGEQSGGAVQHSDQLERMEMPWLLR
jgi:hypothetical protein